MQVGSPPSQQNGGTKGWPFSFQPAAAQNEDDKFKENEAAREEMLDALGANLLEKLCAKASTGHHGQGLQGGGADLIMIKAYLRSKKYCPSQKGLAAAIATTG